MRLRFLVCSFLFAAWAAPAAWAGPLIDGAANALQSDPVYVAPGAEPSISADEADELRAQIAESGEPIFVAILPGEARDEVGGDAADVLREVSETTAREGTYAVVVGGQFRAGSSVLPEGRAADLATQAFEEHEDEGVAPTLGAFVGLVGDDGDGGEDSGGTGGAVPYVLAGVGAVGAGAAGVYLLRRRRRREQAFADVREATEEDLLALGDDIRALELPQKADADTRADYEGALGSYEAASTAFERARKVEDFERVTADLEEGRFAAASAQARLDGRPLPERRLPCFFDPRHGPSVRDVQWAPPGGAPRDVPACEADAVRVESGEEPSFREVPVRGQRVPYWSAPAYYGPWAGGFFGSGLLPGLFIGSLFGGLGPAVNVYEDGDGGDADGGGDVDGGGGDFGGGDWGGGGDFGGGGGDF
jgi:hypothetical protein